MSRAYRLRRGLSLIETLSALFVTSLIIGFFFPAATLASRGVQKATALEAATEIATAKLESYRQAGYGQLPQISDVASSTVETFDPSGNLTDAVGTVTVARVDVNFNETLIETDRRTVTVRISWRDPGRDSRQSVATSTLLISS